jgi:predicted HNH restriction endonuclease
MAITPKYQAYLRSPEWQKIRGQILFDATGNRVKCQRCKVRLAREVHHLTYERIFRERLSDLQPVCSICHQRIHNIKKTTKKPRFSGKIKQIYARIMG